MLATLAMHWKYLKAVLRHKRFVYEEGRALGLGIWQCLIHDWTKFLPVMWGPYARAFYGPKNVKTGKPDGRPDFDRAWLFHQRWERHHWQAWVHVNAGGFTSHQPAPQLGILLEDSGKVKMLDGLIEAVLGDDYKLTPRAMPERYAREMLADWRGANRAYGDQPLTDWYAKTNGARLLHPHTRDWIEAQLGIGFCDECNRLAPLADACAGGCGLTGWGDR